jgi:hypothetical protein
MNAPDARLVWNSARMSLDLTKMRTKQRSSRLREGPRTASRKPWTVVRLNVSTGNKEANMSFAIKEGISRVGKIDWELKKFHGEEYSTRRRSSYNSYLIKDHKIVLIDNAI